MVLCAGLVVGLFPNSSLAKPSPACPDRHVADIYYTPDSFVFDMSFDMKCFGKGAILTYEGALTRRDRLGTQEDAGPKTCKKKRCSVHFELAHDAVEHADYELWFDLQISSETLRLGASGSGQWTCTSAAVQVFCQ